MGRQTDAEWLLRSLGLSGDYKGFWYAVYMIESVAQDPQRVQLITKRLYRDTAAAFGVTPCSVERAMRFLVSVCWSRADRDRLNMIAGVDLQRVPTNRAFIDILAAYLRRSDPSYEYHSSVIYKNM